MTPLSLLIKPASGLCNMNCKYCFYKSASEGRENRIMAAGTVDELHPSVKTAVIKALITNQDGIKVVKGKINVGFLRYEDE